MRRSFQVITSLLMIASLGFGATTVSISGASAQNDAALAVVPITLSNTDAVGGLQFAIKDIPNVLSVYDVIPSGRTSADEYNDNDNSGDYTPGDDLTVDHNLNGLYDGAFSIEFSARGDSSVSVLIYDGGGNTIIPDFGEICKVRFNKPASVTDEIIDLEFHEILNADTPFLLVVSDPEGNALNTTWLNGLLTVGGIEVRLTGGGGTPGTVSAPLFIQMNNAVPVKGIQFSIADGVTNYLTIESVQGLERGSDFTFVGNEVDGKSMILGVDFNGQQIPPGSGNILQVDFLIAANATLSDLTVSISDLIVAAEGGLPIPSNGEDYVFPVTTGVEEAAELPTAFELRQNYPNPFNPTTTIGYSIPEASEVRVGIFNLLGQEIRSLSSGLHQPGVYTAMWDGLNQNGVRVESGIYIYRMTTSSGYNATKKLVMLK